MKIALVSDLHYGFSANTSNTINKFFRKLAKEKPDIVVVAGDTASVCQHQYKRCFETLRENLDSHILTVRGNHDLWDGKHKKDPRSGQRTLQEIYDYQEMVHKVNHIHHLDEPFVYDNVTFFGFDGWYSVANPGTNDWRWIPKQHQDCPVPTYLCSKGFKDFDRVLEQYDFYKNDINILVSHFPSVHGPGQIKELNASPGFVEEIQKRFDVCMNGHTHRFLDLQVGKTRYLNCGSDYNKPKRIILDI